jgi:ribonuclease HI
MSLELSLEIAQSVSRKKSVVALLTDSLSNIQKLKSCKPKTAKEVEMFYAVGNLASLSTVHVAHVRGHAGIRVNEKADILAEQGAMWQVAEPVEEENSITADQFKSEIKDLIVSV